MEESKIVKANEKIAEGVTTGFKKIEGGVVGGFEKITDKFVDGFLTHEGESVEDAKKRMADEQAERETASKAETEKRVSEHQVRGGSDVDIGRTSVEASLEAARASLEASKNAGKHY